ncbi:hypothetical protein TL16_g00894 [Triparma laevis f. inornata]|uniref:Ribosome biogenesis protein BOP1 homolog n=1 Tax=Triparma laevis f. inornata TaxID=1714386 RepID=A0A9W7DPW3_9STRA|nr:hypothetical protein TL16_g00894 [Triparma laevis f. inornata]
MTKKKPLGEDDDVSPSIVDSSEGSDSEESNEEPYDSDADENYNDNEPIDSGDEGSDEGSDAGFEDQGSDSDEDSDQEEESASDSYSETELKIEPTLTPPPPPSFKNSGSVRSAVHERELEKVFDSAAVGHNQSLLHVDDLSSDDEEGNNTIGRVPLHWYDEYDHIGYDVKGEKVMKGTVGDGEGESGVFDELQDSLSKLNDPNKRFTIYDSLNAKEVTLTPREIEVIRRIQAGAYAHPEHEGNPDYVDYFSSEKEISGINSGRPEPKRNFQGSKIEALMVRRLLKRLKDGKIDMDYLTGKKKDMNPKKEEKDDPFLMWKGGEEDELLYRKGPTHIAAAKAKPPSTAESYNPPEEYIPNAEELEAWDKLDVEDRPYGLVVPKKFKNLRSVGAYQHSLRERFERCLDLYLAPREMKRRLNIDPESLVPQLPKPQDLKPYPSIKCVEFNTPGKPKIRDVTVSGDGQYMCSAAEDGYVRLWEIHTGRLMKSWNIGEMAGENGETATVSSVEWNPVSGRNLILACSGSSVFVLGSGTGGEEDCETTSVLAETCVGKVKGGVVMSEKVQKVVKWNVLKVEERGVSKFSTISGPLVHIKLNTKTTLSSWHSKGDYFVTVSPSAGAAAVLIHQLTKGTTQQPFGKTKGAIGDAKFHPTKPFLFVATQQYVKIYHLLKQTMVKKLLPNCKHLTSISIHSSGDHVICGTLDRKLIWFDLDLSAKPYKTLRYHTKAIRAASFHKSHPLMASCSDDGDVHVFHARVYDDLMRNPLIVPVKILKGHEVVGRLGGLGLVWCRRLPWLITCGADGRIVLWQDL